MVWAVCRRLMPDRHAAEDAFQATILVLARKPARVARAGSAAGYLHGVARRVATRCRRRPSAPLTDAPAADAGPLAVAMQREEAETLHAELARLPAGCREALLLCDLGGLSRTEAADRLGWSEGSVKGRLERGRALLAARLARRGITAGLAATAAPAELSASVCRSAVAMWLGGPLPAGLAGLVRAGGPWGAGKVTAAAILALGLVTTLTGVAGTTATQEKKSPVRVDVRAVLRAAEVSLDAASGEDTARVRAAADIAVGYARLGDAAAARARLVKAIDIARRRDPRRYWDLTMPAMVYARLDDPEAVLGLAGGIPADAEKSQGRPREGVVRHAAQAAATAGHPTAADRIARAAPEPADRVRALMVNRVRAAVRLAERGDTPGAIRAAAAIPDPTGQTMALVGAFDEFLALDLADGRGAWDDSIASVRQQAGDRAGAAAAIARMVELLPDMPTEHWRNRAAVMAARAAARLGDLATCRKLVARVGSPPERYPVDFHPSTQAFAHLAAAEVAAGNEPEALRLVDQTHEAARPRVLTAVAIALAEAGRRDQAIAQLRRVEALSGGQERPYYHDLVRAYARAGNLTEADRVWSAHGGGRPFPSWHVIGWTLALRGNLAAAREAAARVDDMEFRGVVLRAIAAQQARTGKAAGARREADAEPDPLRRAFLLAGLAAGLLGDPD